MRGIDNQSIGVILLALGVVAAIFAPEVAGLFAPYALHALFVVICLSLISFADRPSSDLISVDRTTWLIVGWQQVVLPGIVLALGIILEFPDNIVSMMLVTACAGSLFAAPMLAGLLDLNQQRALQSMVLSTIWMPASLYIFLSVQHGAHVHLDLDDYVQRAAIFLAIPFALLWLYRGVLKFLPSPISMGVAVASHWGSIAALLVFGIGIMYPVSLQMHTNPLKIVFYLGIVSTLSVGMFVLTTIVMHRFGTRECLTAGVLSGFRNVGLCLALVGDMLGSELSLYVGLSMLPVFIAPAVIHFLSNNNRTAALDQP